MEQTIKSAIENKNYAAIKELLSNNPELADEGITIPYDSRCIIKAHPLHRICDAVFVKKLADEEAIIIAKIFLDFGADINGSKIKMNDGTPLLAAASLHAEQLGIFYIERGADIFYADKHDGATALHWAAFCGRDKLVSKLIEKNAVIDQRDKSYNCTPLGWALECLMSNDKNNVYHQLACIKLLIKAGADIKALSDEASKHLYVIARDDLFLIK